MAKYVNVFMKGAALTVPFTVLSGVAWAQDREAVARSEGLEEIVVTAQKRSENLQDVPIAVTAISAASLEAKGITSALDLRAIVPGLSYTTNATIGSPRIRGVGTAIAGSGNENAVATYVDGVYYASSTGSVMSFNNIEQVAVLKGPQGTLFGRNATGGLIQITTRDPSESFEGSIKATYGNHETIGGDLYLTGGLAPGLAADVAVHFYDQADGFGVNLFNGQDVNKSRDLSMRTKWKLDLGSQTTATMIWDYSKIRAVLPVFRPVSGVPALDGNFFTGKKFDANSDKQPFSRLEQWGGSLNLAHEFDGAKLVSITAYRSTDWNGFFDADSLPTDLLSVRVTGPDRQFSQELQLLSSDEGALSWVLGAYYFRAAGGYSPALIGGTGSDFMLTLNTRQRTESVAGFGQATLKFSEMTSLTIGARLTNEVKRMKGRADYYVISADLHVPQGPYADKISVTKPTWRVALDHQLNDDAMVYASYNRGFKSGGFDPGSSSAALSFKPEVLDAFEVGLKSEIMDRRVRLNGAVFYYDYRDIQLNTFVSGLLSIYNGKSAEIYGVDFDVTAAPTDNLTLTGGLSWLHGRYGDFPITVTQQVPTGGIVQLPDESAKGKRLQNTPDWQLNLGFNYDIPLSSGHIQVAADYSYSSRWYATPENRLGQKGYSLFNASLTWSVGEQDKYSMKLWGRNLGNVAYADQLTIQVPVTDFVSMAAGRTFGATAGVRF